MYTERPIQDFLGMILFARNSCILLVFVSESIMRRYSPPKAGMQSSKVKGNQQALYRGHLLMKGWRNTVIKTTGLLTKCRIKIQTSITFQQDDINLLRKKLIVLVQFFQWFTNKMPILPKSPPTT